MGDSCEAMVWGFFLLFEPQKPPVVSASYGYLKVTAATIALDNSDTKKKNKPEVELPPLSGWRPCLSPAGLPAHFKLSTEFILSVNDLQLIPDWS